MRDAAFYTSSLLDLHKATGAAEKRAAWRQSMAALARATAEDGPGPLEGLHPEALVQGVRAALGAGLVDDLDWLAPAAAGAALFELASALPIGVEQREIGRRVLARLMAADAQAFVAIAWRMALSSPKALGSPAVRARVALVTELPIGLGIGDGPLALAIAARRESAREWIAEASTGSLPSRRLAARLIERAALEAARRASQGDDHALRVFRSDAIAPAWQRLLADRESLVWRHVAVARGLLAPWEPAQARAIDEALAPSLSPTEWRRAAASIAAYTAVAPEAALALAKRAIAGGLLDRDPGAASAFLWGLPRAAEAEPEAARQIVDRVFERARAEIGEAVVELRSELGESKLGDRAAAVALELHAGRDRHGGDDGAEALAQEVARDLAGGAREDQPLRDQIDRALGTFATSGAREAQSLARNALAAAEGALAALEAVTVEDEEAKGGGGSIARRTSLAVLRDLDVSLLERDVLGHLLALGGNEAARAASDALDPLRDRLSEWILAREAKPLAEAGGGGDDGGGDKARPAHPTMTLRRLRALLHLVDGDIGDEDANPHRAARLRKRWIRVARALLDRFEHGPSSIVRRTVVAALARALDGLVRVGSCDVVDVLLVVARNVVGPAEMTTLAEASMNPDLVHVLQRYGHFLSTLEAGPGAALPAFDDMTREIAPDASGRMEALRTVLVRVGTALRAVAAASALRDLAPTREREPEAVGALEGGLASLVHLGLGARGRFDPDWTPSEYPAAAQGAARPLTVAVARVLSGADAALDPKVVDAALDGAVAGVPRGIAQLVRAVVLRLTQLPLEGVQPSVANVRVAEALPAWLPAPRTIGGFYVVRALGAGAGGSVFVVTRVEDKNDPSAERLALKVPEYSATAARSVSEAEFLKMFRSEAGALIALPQHPNLARFVTFDAGSKPKPILVMEFVEGHTLERLLETRALDTPRAVSALDQVLQGLEAMHAVGVAHLDLKPSNVVLRKGEEAVLVDFGLAGRHVRPGCATGPYGAPEVWGALDALGATPAPKADVYAFACVAFETLTGRVLFDAENELQQVAMHVAHDGFPAPLRALASHARLAPLAEVLFAMLRRDPADRITSAVARKELARLAPVLGRCPWPIDAR